MGKNRLRISPVTAILAVIMLGLFIGTAFYTDSQKDIAAAQTEKELPVVGSLENLRSLLEQYGQNNGRLYRGMAVDMSGAVNNMKSAESLPAADQAADYSATNVQVEGVDEGDQVKTDGQYIYQINNNLVQIIKAVPADQMQLVNTLKFNDQNFTPVDLYIDGDYMIVIGNTYIDQPTYPTDQSNLRKMPAYMPPYYHPNTSLCRAIVYNIKDKQNISQIRRLVLEGNYLASRLVDGKFYLLSNCYLDYYSIQNGTSDTDVTPICKDTIKADRFDAQDIKTIRYFPGCITSNYLVAGSIDLQQMEQPADINTYLGGGENVYASTNNLYVALSQYNGGVIQPYMKSESTTSAQTNTKIFKFSLQNAKLQYEGEGQVPGTILNQFSMDEYNDHFRIATTYGETWREDEFTSQNNVYILDKDLKLTGKIENIAPGERIYSTRFMGGRAYMVTFKQVDPFFVLDLSDPAQPKILGKLKIPGYSDYLHPYDENHIIGFGKETVEASGFNGVSTAFYQGLKIAIFDVTDVSQPVEMSKVVIGDRGSDSELLRNHKALLFSRDKNLLALPVTVMAIDQKNIKASSANIPEYGSFSFQGAYIYNIDLQNGLQYKGRITHLNDEDYVKAGNYWNATEKSISRILYIGDNLYTLSPAMIKSNQLDSLQEKQVLTLQ